MLTLANGQTLSPNGTLLQSKIKRQVKPKSGYILYQGPSVLDGAPIVVIATMSTTNEKTGNMVQTWIMRDDISPLEASAASLDSSVCGMCPHRTSLKGACYVTLHQAPLAVWKAYKNNKYKWLDAGDYQHFSNRSVRLGSYGDPAAVPFKVWANITSISQNFTGYTHQLKHKNFDVRLTTLCQVSVDTEAQAKHAQKAGYKTYRVKTENMRVLDGEIVCLADTMGISCIECGLCNGQQANITINVHGRSKNRFDKFERII
ncbi:hypothetical protein [Yersinia phage vB_YenM_P778]